MRESSRAAGGEVVNAEHGVAVGQEAVGEMGTKEAGGAGKKNVHGFALGEST